jgi:hypothetical protein
MKLARFQVYSFIPIPTAILALDEKACAELVETALLEPGFLNESPLGINTFLYSCLGRSCHAQKLFYEALAACYVATERESTWLCAIFHRPDRTVTSLQIYNENNANLLNGKWPLLLSSKSELLAGDSA